MGIWEHLKEFEGLSVEDFRDDTSPFDNTKAIRLGLDWELHESGKTFVNLFASFLEMPDTESVRALLISDWGGTGEGNDSTAVVEALVSAREKMPNLCHLFLGEITVEESEISWINQSDVSPIFGAFPALESFYIRGGNGLRIGKPKHEKLKKFVIQTGGLGGEIVRSVASAEFPELTHLELWLGDPGYGYDVSEEDIRTLLSSDACKKLTYLGLKDDSSADATVKLLVESGVPATLKSLDLSLGTVGDEGVIALAECPWIGQLESLDISHHYCSDKVVEKMKAVVSNVTAADPQEPDVWDGESHRYVAVSE